jgi:hypothetical protein
VPHTNATARAIQEMVRFFLPHCSDQSTLRELDRMASDDRQWRYAHALFGRIRDKTLRAEDAKDILRQHQYSFEEICAKTLFNMSDHYDPQCKKFPAPFDADSPFWVVPIAVGFARALGMDDPYRVSSLLQPNHAPPGRRGGWAASWERAGSAAPQAVVAVLGLSKAP